jgi:hypothetical protein
MPDCLQLRPRLDLNHSKVLCWLQREAKGGARRVAEEISDQEAEVGGSEW